MPTPTATIVIPCFNHGRFVGEAVKSCLVQHAADVRVVVVNDGSDDGQTPAQCDALLDDFGRERVAVIHQANAGLPAARNRGAKEATGDFIAFLDADDWIRPEFVSKLASAIRSSGDDTVSHAYCQEELVELGQGVWRVPEWDAELMLITNLHPVTALLRRDRFESLGGFDDTMTSGYEDWELWIRCVARGWRGVRVREPLFVWRRHSETTMVIEAVQRHDELVASIIDRHRSLYEERSEALYRRCNAMLRRFDCNWLDESGDPIPLRHLREIAAAAPALHEQVAHLRGERDHYKALAQQIDDGWKQVHADYEAMTVIKLHHRWHSLRRALPGPVRALLGAPASLVRAISGGSRRSDGP